MGTLELSRCPFCGGSAELVLAKHDKSLKPGVDYYYIKHVAYKDTCGLVDAFGAFRSRLYPFAEEAVAMWNRRYHE